MMDVKFSLRNLSVLSHANGFTLWHYRGDNAPIAALRKSGFFVDASDMVVSGDMVLLTGSDGGAFVFVGKDSTTHSFVTAGNAP